MLPAQPEAERRCPTCAAPAEGAYCRLCGHAQPGAAVRAGNGRGILLPARPGSLTGIAVVGLALGMVLVIAVTVLGVRAVFFAPDDLVRDYFGALASRNADRAWSMLDRDGSRSVLLSAATLDSPGYRPPTNATVESLSREGQEAVAMVAYEVEGMPQRAEVTVNRDARGILQRWQIDGGLYPLHVAGAPGADLLFAGARVPLDRLGEAAGFPGGYQVALADHPLYELQPAVAIAGGEPAALSYQIHGRGGGVIEDQVRAYIDSCLESDQLAPDGCPFAASTYDPFGEYVDVTWTLIEYPSIEYALQEDGNVYLTGTGGVATVTATSTSSFTPDLDEEVPMAVQGWVGVEEGQVWFEPDEYFD